MKTKKLVEMLERDLGKEVEVKKVAPRTVMLTYIKGEEKHDLWVYVVKDAAFVRMFGDRSESDDYTFAIGYGGVDVTFCKTSSQVLNRLRNDTSSKDPAF